MPQAIVVLTDTVFVNLDLTRQALSRVNAELRIAEQPSSEAIVKVVQDADAVLVTYAKLTNEIIREMTRCQIIARCGIGIDNIDVAAASRAGIVVTNVPDYCVDEVSDHAMALLLALARKIPLANARAHTGRWELAATSIHRLRGNVVGLVGFGKIAKALVPKAKSFGLKVISYDPFVAPTTMLALGVEKVDISELLSASDYISIHSPLVAATDRLFRAENFCRMKPTAYLINTSRGGIVDEADLARALDAGQLAGAALDVLSHEPPADSPLIGREDVILSPHMSFYSLESLIELQAKSAEEVVRVLKGEMPRYAVNPEVLQLRS
ncbi:MAG: C-terminal binding protein [Acidobacteria bacterium]|nr:C-terminal binding protein [Acidobacteriota bacterium]MBV9479646.1 C-terminal binding protein [Acidobacteriota bacterium]